MNIYAEEKDKQDMKKSGGTDFAVSLAGARRW